MALSFDATYYMSARPDVLNAYIAAGAEAGTGMNWAQFAEQHYNDFGWKEGYNPNAIFNTSEYLAANIDVLNAGVNPFQHYLQFGAYEKRAPSDSFISFEDFDWETYLAANSDLTDAGILTAEAAYGHYVIFGQFEVRDGKPEAPVPSVPGVTYTLTNGLDEFPGTVNDDTFQGFIQHLNGFDNLKGGGGHDVLNLHGDDAIAAVNTWKVDGIETINLIGAGNAGVNASAFKGASEIWQNGRNGDVTGLIDGQTAGFRGAANTVANPYSADFTGSEASIAYQATKGVDTNNAGRVSVEVGGEDVETLDVAGSLSGGAGFLRLDAKTGSLPTDLSTINLDIDTNTTITFGANMITRAGHAGVFGNVETVNASESSGNLTLNLAWSSGLGPIFEWDSLDLETLTLGSGNDLVGMNIGTFSADAVSVDLGAGADRIQVQLGGTAADLAITGGAGADIFQFIGGNVELDLTKFDKDMGAVSITDFGNGADTIALNGFTNFDGSFAAANAITAALEALAPGASLYAAVKAVADVVESTFTDFAQFAFGDTTYLYGDNNAGGLADGDLLVDLNGAELSAINVVGLQDWSLALNTVS